MSIDVATLRILEFYKIRERLVEKCVSRLGKQHAEELEPAVFEQKIKQDLNQTAEAEGFIIRYGTPPLGNIHDIRGTLRRVELGAILNPAELLYIAAILRSVKSLKKYGKEGSSTTMLRAAADQQTQEGVKIEESLTQNSVLQLIGALVYNQRLDTNINACILNEEELADDASPTLLSIRRQMRRLAESIKDKLNAIIKSTKYQKFVQDSIVTIRQDRYVIPVKQEHRTEISGLIHDTSSSGATVFIEPMAVVETNNEIKQLKGKEQVEIDRILAELTSEVAGMLPALTLNVENLGLLDFLFAKGKLSLELNCVTPEIGAQTKIRIKKGRHPLLPKNVVVPTDFWMENNVNTIIITGPNTGGKTVALKTVGLFTLMAQAGLNIPAASGSSLRIFKKIFADIGDEQSIEQSLSTFSSHMKNIVRILKDADDETLAMFDEIGAGTDPTEGAAIATSILECLHQTGTTTVATTHYSELKIYALTTDGIENACCEFDVSTLRPTYKLLIGVPGKSNAFAISSRLGLPAEILERAKEFLTQENIEFEEVLLNIEKNKIEAEAEKLKAESLRQEIETLKNELEQQKRKLDAQREKSMREAREEARRYLTDSKREAENILDKLRQLEKEEDLSARRKEEMDLRKRLKDKTDEVDESLAFQLPEKHGYVEPPKNLKKGDTVLIVNLDQRGTVQNPPDKSGDVPIQVGIMSIKAHISNLRLVDEQKEQIARSQRSGLTMSKTLHMKTEIDLRGTRLEDAVVHVDKYLDDVALSGLHEVTIIHGKGTGTLRTGIQKFLKKHPRVKTFRDGKFGEGDSGVTVVEIK